MQVFLLGRGVGIPVVNILDFHISTVTGSQTDLVLHQRMEGEQSKTKINATDVCFPTLDYPGLIVNLVHKSDKMPLFFHSDRVRRKEHMQMDIKHDFRSQT